MTTAPRPKVNSDAQKELDKAVEKVDAFNDSVKALNLDAMNKAPVLEQEEQTKLSTKEIKNMGADYLKPIRSIASREKFNESFRKQWEKGWEYVKVVVENYEIIGEMVECWTKKFPGDPAHFWKVPVNKPIHIPRLLAEQLASCKYHRLMMDDHKVTGGDQMGTYTGGIVVSHQKHRIDCKPVGFEFSEMAR